MTLLNEAVNQTQIKLRELEKRKAELTSNTDEEAVNKLELETVKKSIDLGMIILKVLEEHQKEFKKSKDDVTDNINHQDNIVDIENKVNHPSYYNSGNIEVIDYIQDKNFGFCLGNAIKYISRAGLKNRDTKVEDLKKAIWYIEKEIESL